MTRIKIKSPKRAPKTYKKPKELSLDATGLLAHMRENQTGDGIYNWGVLATAEFFGLSGRNRIAAAYKELEKAKRLVRIDVPRDPSQKQPPTVVKLIPCSQIHTAQVLVNTGRDESRNETTAQKTVFTREHLPISPIRNNSTRTPTTAPIDQTTTVSPIAPNIGMFTGEHGSELQRLQDQLDDAEQKLEHLRAQYGDSSDLVHIQVGRVGSLKSKIARAR